MRVEELFEKFPRVFWAVNAMELFERGAYYGMLAILPYYLVYTLDFASTAFGVLLGVLTPFLYLLPIVSGALTEKYGFRAPLAISLGLVSAGYLLSSLMTTFEAFVMAFVVLGIGVGSFKPIISATIALTTKPEARNLGYSIYYWMINLGSFTMPLLISLTIPKEQYVLVFYLSAALIGVNIALTLTVYRDPVRPNPAKSAGDVFRDAALVLKDLRFVALLLIYSGFWFMYATNHLAILLYALDFGVLGEYFPPALVATVNPGTIIILGPFLGKIFEKSESLKVMVFGMSVFIAGLLLMGFTTVSAVFFTGIVIFSIGEFITHPTYISYVSKIAPKERVTLYMAYAFIPPLIGLSLGNVLGGVMYATFSEVMHRPRLFWAAISAVGMVTIALLLLYGQRGVRKKVDEEARAGSGEQSGIWVKSPVPSAGLGGPAGEGSVERPCSKPYLQSFFNSTLGAVVCLLLVPVLLGAAYASGTEPFLRDAASSRSGGWAGYELVSSEPILLPGSSEEHTETREEIDIEERNLASLTFTLRWTDEEDIVRLLRTYENQPDEFGLAVVSPGGIAVSSGMVSNPHGREGSVSVSLTFNFSGPEDARGNGTYKVTIACGNCGDFFPAFGIIGFTDTGNDWTLEVKYDYYRRVEH
ncbi:MAG: MFS transporter [Thermoplasmata archaeon]